MATILVGRNPWPEGIVLSAVEGRGLDIRHPSTPRLCHNLHCRRTELWYRRAFSLVTFFSVQIVV